MASLFVARLLLGRLPLRRRFPRRPEPRRRRGEAVLDAGEGLLEAFGAEEDLAHVQGLGTALEASDALGVAAEGARCKADRGGGRVQGAKRMWVGGEGGMGGIERWNGGLELGFAGGWVELAWSWALFGGAEKSKPSEDALGGSGLVWDGFQAGEQVPFDG